MSRYPGNLTFEGTSQPIVGADIYVYTTNGDLAVLKNASNVVIENPVTSDAQGNFEFYADDGIYTLAYHYGGRKQRVDNFVQVGAAPPLPASILASLITPGGAALVGSNDGASGSLWTTIAEFITYLRSSAGSSILGFLQSGTGAVTRSVSAKLKDAPVSPEDFGAVGDGTTDDSAAIQKAFDTGKSVILRNVTYRINTGIRMKTTGQRIYAERAVLDYYGSGYAFDIDDTVAAVAWLADCQIEGLWIYLRTSGATGFRVRFSYTTFQNCGVGAIVSNVTAWRIETDANTGNAGAGGTGPYYNLFNNCHAIGKTFNPGITNQTGVVFTTYSGLGSRGPNANVWLGGRIGGFTNNFIICGHGNKIIGVTSEAVASGGYHFKVDNPYNTLGDAGSYCNVILAPYIEGNAGANGFLIGPTSYGTTIVFDGPTSLGGGTLFTDNGAATTWQKADGLRMPNAGSTDNRTFDWYEENSFTPAVTGDGTAGAQTYGQQYGRFTRIGNRVLFDVAIVLSAKDAATAGNLTITGLPYASASTNYSSCAVANAKFDLTAGYTQIGARIDPSQSYIKLLQDGDNVSPALLTATNLLGTTEIYVSGSYRV